MSKIEVNKVGPQCGTTVTVGCGAGQTVVVDANTVTLGRSGGTVSLASGATQSGFGRTGTVDWQTGSIKTSTFTAANGEGYFVDTSSGAITANLPAGSAGAIVSFADYTRTFGTNNLTINPNGSEKIGGVADDAIMNVNGQALTLVYVDATEGWINIQNAEDTEIGIVPAFVTATGGTVTCCGNFKIHTFTGPGTFCVSSAGNCRGSNTVDYLVVAGGGGGGFGNDNGSGGGGGGGFRLSNTTCMSGPQTSPLASSTAIPVTAQGYPIAVGGGGPNGTSPSPRGTRGSCSSFSTITSTGGGGGGGSTGGTEPGLTGGSGGGGGGESDGAGGAGNTPPVSPPQGQNGGTGENANGQDRGGGGGGAGAAGSPGSDPSKGCGGAGSFVVSAGFAGCNGTSGPVSGARYFAGGAGGGSNPPGAGTGGVGGGGNGTTGPTNATPGTTNTGGGGGGGSLPVHQSGKVGGSGIVIIRYRYQ